jgi:hypothetical protein
VSWHERRGEVEPREGEGLGEVGLALGPVVGLAGVDLDDDEAVEAASGEPLEQLGAGLGAAPGTRCSSRAVPVPSAM